MKTKVNPVEMKVGINSLKSLRNGLIELYSREEAEKICNNINEKCGEELEATMSKKMNPRIIVFNTPEEITMETAVEALTTQNEELKKFEKDITPKFCFEDRRKNKNLVIEVSSAARKEILGRKLKLQWNMCNWDDYIKVGRCFKCSKYNHRAQDCNGQQTCPNCTQNHTLHDCKTPKESFKCINCANYNNYNSDNAINVNHSALDPNFPCHQAAIRRHKENTDY